MAVDIPTSSVQRLNNLNSNSKFTKLAVNTLQRKQIESMRLSFLLRCRELKRPPPSLRCTGFSALAENERIELLSEAESASLSKAIAKKKKEIKLLSKIVERSKKVLAPLSKRQVKRWKCHFNKNMSFCRKKLQTGPCGPKSLLMKTKKSIEDLESTVEI